MNHDILIGISLVLGLGIGAQWLAWRFNIPAILVLMITGIIAGPVTGYFDPNLVFGDLLMPLVSVSIGIILFEGGLDLKISELKQVGKIVGNLVTIGVIATWVLASLAANFVFGLPWELSIILGAILTVTGPTVIIPLIRHIRLTGSSSVGTALKWEGIVIDPIGAVFAVLVLNAVLIGDMDQVSLSTADAFKAVSLLTLKAVFITLFVGVLLGVASSALIISLFRHHLIPDFLKNPAALALVVVAFVLSNCLQHEAGLLTTTIMGVMLANQKFVRIKQLAEFKETLRVLLISGLFIILSARIDLTAFSRLGLQSFFYVLILIFFIRPISVFISTYNSNLTFKEKIFLSSLAPRGIVAAAVASLFAIELQERNFENYQAIADITFMVIIGTVLFYAIFSPIIARALGLSSPDPQGVLIIGAHKWAREIAESLQSTGTQVLMFDTNALNVKRARDMGIAAQNVNVVFDSELDELILEGTGKLVALTSNDEVNTLSGIHFLEHFGEASVYQLSPQSVSGEAASSQNLPTRVLFGSEYSFSQIEKLYRAGAKVKTLEIEEDKEIAELSSDEEVFVPFFFVKESGVVDVFGELNAPKTISKGKLVYLSK